MRVLRVFIQCLLLTAACSNPSAPTVDSADTAAEISAVEVISEVLIVADVATPDSLDSFVTDLALDHSSIDIPPLGCDPGEGCFLDQCTENSDCQSGWCVQHLGESACSQICQEECPPGWNCQQVAGTVPDIVYICVSDYANLCRPCAAGDDCTSTGGSEDACVDYGTDGSFCGGLCAVDDDCPWGFSCLTTSTVDGISTLQCVAETGLCPCTDRSAELALWTPCEVENEFGLCTGKRVCEEDGLSGCDAPLPVAELCNGLDDDCDGEADEPTLVEGAYVELCDDGNDCTDDSCSGPEGCLNEILDSGSCDDGNPCTVADHCEVGACVGKPVDCDDDNPCTDDSCTEDGGCLSIANEEICDDADSCTVADRCADSICSGTAVSCECQEDADCADLEDGDLCNGTLVCNTDKLPHLCVVDPSTTIECPAPDGVHSPCLEPSCDAQTGECELISHNENGPCDTGSGCTIKDICLEGACTPGADVNCNDGNPCTDDSCDTDLGCLSTANTASCNDGNVCTSSDLCQAGECVGGDVLECGDGDVCNGVETCEPDTGCQPGIPLVCDDGNPCNGGETCDPESGCVDGGILLCDDGNLCTDDGCDAKDGCFHVSNNAPCDDGNLCTTEDHCQEGTCKFGQAVLCNDDDICTDDSCDPLVGCLFEMNSALCDDGNVCTLGDTCELGQCAGGLEMVCDDGNLCTTDACVPGVGCQFLPNQAGCDDGNACTDADGCDAGWCQGTPVSCDDNNYCTADSCDAAQGCLHDALPDGSQLTGCNGFCEACVAGACGPAEAGTDNGDDCDPAEEFQIGGDPYFCQRRLQSGECDGDGGCSEFGQWDDANDGQQCSSEPYCKDDIYYATVECSSGSCNKGATELGCCGDSVCDENFHCDEEKHECVADGPACQGWEYDGYCWYYDSDKSYENTCTELCQKHGAECVLEGRLQEAVNPQCTVCKHFLPNLQCNFGIHDEPAKPCTYASSKCEYANYTPAVSTCDGPKYGTYTQRFCSCTF
jgi:hypothetical protein